MLWHITKWFFFHSLAGITRGFFSLYSLWEPARYLVGKTQKSVTSVCLFMIVMFSGNRDFLSVIKLIWCHSEFGWALIQWLRKQRGIWTVTLRWHTGMDFMWSTEIGVMHLARNTNACWQLQEAQGRIMEQILPLRLQK